MEDEIIALILEVNPYADVTLDSNLLEEGVLDSLGILNLLDGLEMKYVFKLPEEELKAENFVTVEAICALVERVRRDETERDI